MVEKRLALAALCSFALLFGCFGQDLSPTGVSSSAVAGGIQVSWAAVGGIAGYNVYRSTDTSVLGEKINPSLIVGETSYRDTSVSNGITYYYTVKSVDAGGKEYGANKASATARLGGPAGLQISINGGANATSSTGVSLTLSASGAKECRLSNDGSAWSDWSAYTQQATWALPSGDGQKTVYFTCRDDVGNIAQPVSASIYLASAGLQLAVESPVEGGQYAGGFDLVFTVNDPIADKVTCTGKLDGQVVDVGVADVGIRYNFSIPAAPGRHTMYGECNDGVLSMNRSATFTVTDKPYVTISIGDGSGYTATAATTVEVNATSASQCRLSNDQVSWGNWMAYAQFYNWQLTGGEGAKTVYAQCKGATGALSDMASDTITVDTSPPPYISVSINNGASRANSRQVTLGLYAFAASECRFSNDNQNAWSAWEPYTTRRSWTLSVGDGTKYVYYTCRKTSSDSVGMASASVYMYEIPPGPPTNMDVQINGGASSTTTRTVDLTLDADRADMCRYGEDNSRWTDWEEYSNHHTFTLSSSNGLKTVYYQCKNDYGTASTYSTIYYGADPPSGLSIVINSGAQYTSNPNVYLTLYANRAESCMFREEGYSWSGWETYTTSRSFTLSTGDGQKTIDYQCRNQAGTSSVAYGRIYLDTAPPPPITDLSANAGPNYVSLGWSPPERGGTPIKQYKIYRSTAGFGLITQIGTTTTPGYYDYQVTAGETYNYWVRSVDMSDQESSDSNMASATIGLVVETPTPAETQTPLETPTQPVGPLGP